MMNITLQNQMRNIGHCTIVNKNFNYFLHEETCHVEMEKSYEFSIWSIESYIIAVKRDESNNTDKL